MLLDAWYPPFHRVDLLSVAISIVQMNTRSSKKSAIDADCAVNYHSDSEGTALNNEVLSESICSVRCSKPLDRDWKKRIDEDHRCRE